MTVLLGVLDQQILPLHGQPGLRLLPACALLSIHGFKLAVDGARHGRSSMGDTDVLPPPTGQNSVT